MQRHPPTRNDDDELALLVVLGTFWFFSLLRVYLGIASHEVFGGEGSLAVLAALLLPFLMRDALVKVLRNVLPNVRQRARRSGRV